MPGRGRAQGAYIQRSRGEFSCAKPSYVRQQTSWISDRTLCYLASGKPVVVQNTGPTSFLPNGEGMFRFSTLEEAVNALAVINSDYARHCRAAREIVKAHFDSRKTLEGIMNLALGGIVKQDQKPSAGPTQGTEIVREKGAGVTGANP
jgi:hypothetical protein